MENLIIVRESQIPKMVWTYQDIYFDLRVAPIKKINNESDVVSNP